MARLARYVDRAIVQLARRLGDPHPLAQALQGWTAQIAALRAGETLNLRPADYFYRLLALEPFRRAVRNVLNLGKYERHYWQGVTFGGKDTRPVTEQALYEYLAFILLYSNSTARSRCRD